MADIIDMIRTDVEEDPSLKVRGFLVDLESKGFLVKRKTIRVSGRVTTQRERDKIESIVNHHVGDGYDVEMDVRIEEPTKA
jgi:hypothetical protein